MPLDGANTWGPSTCVFAASLSYETEYLRVVSEKSSFLYLKCRLLLKLPKLCRVRCRSRRSTRWGDTKRTKAWKYLPGVSMHHTQSACDTLHLRSTACIRCKISRIYHTKAMSGNKAGEKKPKAKKEEIAEICLKALPPLILPKTWKSSIFDVEKDASPMDDPKLVAAIRKLKRRHSVSFSTRPLKPTLANVC